MIKLPNPDSNLYLNITLKNGAQYIEMDTTDQPFSDDNSVVAFWEDPNTLIMIPMSEVSSVEIVFDKPNEDVC